MDEGPFQQVQQLSTFFFVSRALHVVAELGVADVLGEDASPVGAVAAATGSDADALSRLLRLLSSYGIFELRGASVSHTPASELLRSDHPSSIRDFVRMTSLPVVWRSAERLLDSVRTGEAAAAQAFPGDGFWGYLAKHPDEARLFDAAMTARARGQIGAIVAAHDFSKYRSVADIGGGRGHLLRAILAAHPGVRGVLFDLPHVVEAARSRCEPDDRLTFTAGDFFKDELPRCDAYILMEILHDWSDEPARDIVSAVRRAAAPDSKLLVIETVVPEGPAPDWSKILDVIMLALFAGRQRAAKEYGELLRKGGFELRSEVDTGAGISVFEAEPV
ncbi:MAG TPA: methyltransferase [Microvirga sp.]|nr:methyltransferase [Microvirga sp.]